MAKPKSEEKRAAILSAATREFAANGLSASTAKIAQQAGVASGSLFTYFDTKSDLINQLYLELKDEMASTSLEGFPRSASLREQVFHVWKRWAEWAAEFPEKRRTLAQLDASDEVFAESRAATRPVVKDVADLMDRMQAAGPLRDTSVVFAFAIMHALSEATMDFMIRDPENADHYCEVGFEALWRAIK